jgi:hypothetical protein
MIVQPELKTDSWCTQSVNLGRDSHVCFFSAEFLAYCRLECLEKSTMKAGQKNPEVPDFYIREKQGSIRYSRTDGVIFSLSPSS